jgi:hypothetical protein
MTAPILEEASATKKSFSDAWPRVVNFFQVFDSEGVRIGCEMGHLGPFYLATEKPNDMVSCTCNHVDQTSCGKQIIIPKNYLFLEIGLATSKLTDKGQCPA